MPVRELFDKIYRESMNRLTWGVGVDKMLAKNLAYVLNRNIAIDLGCGDGRNLFYIVKKGGFKRVIALDISRYAILKVKRIAKMLEVENKIETLVEDMREFHLGVEKYSLIVSTVSLSFMRKNESLGMIERIKRAVEPGGGVYITVFNTLSPHYKGVGKIEVYSENWDYWTCFYKVGELKRLFSNQSFRVVDYKEVILKIHYPSLEAKRDLATKLGFSGIFAIKRLPLETKVHG